MRCGAASSSSSFRSALPIGWTSTYPASCATSFPGILNWAIAGCLAWQQVGLAPPAKVQAATESYRKEQDVIGQFI